MRVATASESFKKIFHPWVERAVVQTKTLVVHAKQLLEMVLDNLLERVGYGLCSRGIFVFRVGLVCHDKWPGSGRK